jgi:hypothetical protein
MVADIVNRLPAGRPRNHSRANKLFCVIQGTKLESGDHADSLLLRRSCMGKDEGILTSDCACAFMSCAVTSLPYVMCGIAL